MISNNNQFLNSVTTILVYGFTNKMLELKITMFASSTQTNGQSIHVHHSAGHSWCHAIETTQAVGKFLFHKSSFARRMAVLDNNLPALFAEYINKHPTYKPDVNHLVAKQMDFCPQTQTIETYADTLKRLTQITAQEISCPDHQTFQ